MVVKITRAKVLLRCLRPVRRTPPIPVSWRGPQAWSKRCTVRHAVSTPADRRSIAQDGRPISCLAVIAADGGAGKDAAAEARVLSMQEEIVLTVGGERRTRNPNTDEGCW